MTATRIDVSEFDRLRAGYDKQWSELTGLWNDLQQAVADGQAAASRGDIEAADELKAHAAALLECAKSTASELKKELARIETVKIDEFLGAMAEAEGEDLRASREEERQTEIKLTGLRQRTKILAAASAPRVASVESRENERNSWLARAQADRTNLAQKTLAQRI